MLTMCQTLCSVLCGIFTITQSSYYPLFQLRKLIRKKKTLNKMSQLIELLMVNWDSKPDNLIPEPKLQHWIVSPPTPTFPQAQGNVPLSREHLGKHWGPHSCSNSKFMLYYLHDLRQVCTQSLLFSVSSLVKCGRCQPCSMAFEDQW